MWIIFFLFFFLCFRRRGSNFQLFFHAHIHNGTVFTERNFWFDWMPLSLSITLMRSIQFCFWFKLPKIDEKPFSKHKCLQRMRKPSEWKYEKPFKIRFRSTDKYCFFFFLFSIHFRMAERGSSFRKRYRLQFMMMMMMMKHVEMLESILERFRLFPEAEEQITYY